MQNKMENYNPYVTGLLFFLNEIYIYIYILTKILEMKIIDHKSNLDMSNPVSLFLLLAFHFFFFLNRFDFGSLQLFYLAYQPL